MEGELVARDAWKVAVASLALGGATGWAGRALASECGWPRDRVWAAWIVAIERDGEPIDPESQRVWPPWARIRSPEAEGGDVLLELEWPPSDVDDTGPSVPPPDGSSGVLLLEFVAP